MIIKFTIIALILGIIIDKVYAGTGTAIGYQYDGYLGIEFQITLAPPDNIGKTYYDYYCLSIPYATVTSPASYQLTLTESSTMYWLSDLEIYFKPTSQYIGYDVGGLANTQLSGLTDLNYSPPTSGTTGTSTGTLNGMISGFNQICFSNVCGRATGASSNFNCNQGNTFTGNLQLYGVTAVLPTFSPTKSPTNKPSLTPTSKPSIKPTYLPTFNPSRNPTNNPSVTPTYKPTISPTKKPFINLSNKPTTNPTFQPTNNPSFRQVNPSSSFSPTNNLLQQDPKITETNNNDNNSNSSNGNEKFIITIVIISVVFVFAVVLVVILSKKCSIDYHCHYCGECHAYFNNTAGYAYGIIFPSSNSENNAKEIEV